MKRHTTLTFWYYVLRGLLRLTLGRCPECNDNAPETFNCHVCGYKTVPDTHWQDRWLSHLMKTYL